MKPILEVSQLRKSFCHNPVVDGVEFSVQPGEIFALLGPSGCGKTTTLRLIGGFEKADSGSAFFDGKTIFSGTRFLPPEKRGIGIVFQDYALFPHLTVAENIQFGLHRMTKKQKQQRLDEVLEMVKLTSHRNRMPQSLSAGEQQRVALARSIAPSPQMVLLDEAFCNLDAGLRANTLFEVRTLLKQQQTSAILVTHDQEEALCIADRIAVMHQGKLAQIGTPEEIYKNPKTKFVAEFIGTTNIIEGEAQGDYAKTALGNIPINRKLQGNVVLSIRPEHIAMNLSQEGATIIARDFKGHDQIFTTEYNQTNYQILTDYQASFRIGEKVCLQVREPAIVVGHG